MLKIKRGTEKKDIKVIRGEIEESTVEQSSISDKIGYVKILSFGSNTAKHFNEAINSFESSGKESVIIDLRSNPGGYFDEGTEVADRILPKCRYPIQRIRRVMSKTLTPMRSIQNSR